MTSYSAAGGSRKSVGWAAARANFASAASTETKKGWRAVVDNIRADLQSDKHAALVNSASETDVEYEESETALESKAAALANEGGRVRVSPATVCPPSPPRHTVVRRLLWTGPTLDGC